MLKGKWFTEADARSGTAFSLRLGKQVHSERSPLQSIDVYRTETFGHLMAIDGCTMVSTRDNFLYHEMVSHPALNSHPKPARVAIIGGGDCGTLQEVLKHREVKEVTQAEIDERVTRVSEKYFPELCAANDDPRATLHFGDGIAWMKKRAKASLDVIIVDSTDPVGPAEGLFNRKFFRSCLRALAPKGLLVQQSESPLLNLELIQAMHREMRAAGFAQTRLLTFPQPIYPSGWWSATIAQKSKGKLAERLSPAHLKRLNTRYYNKDIHRAAFAVPNFVREALARL